jgi:hypothetical protein
MKRVQEGDMPVAADGARVHGRAGDGGLQPGRLVAVSATRLVAHAADNAGPAADKSVKTWHCSHGGGGADEIIDQRTCLRVPRE